MTGRLDPAVSLFRDGFSRSRAVLAALGSDRGYSDWGVLSVVGCREVATCRTAGTIRTGRRGWDE